LAPVFAGMMGQVCVLAMLGAAVIRRHMRLEHKWPRLTENGTCSSREDSSVPLGLLILGNGLATRGPPIPGGSPRADAVLRMLGQVCQRSSPGRRRCHSLPGVSERRGPADADMIRGRAREYMPRSDTS